MLLGRSYAQQGDLIALAAQDLEPEPIERKTLADFGNRTRLVSNQTCNRGRRRADANRARDSNRGSAWRPGFETIRRIAGGFPPAWRSRVHRDAPYSSTTKANCGRRWRYARICFLSVVVSVANHGSSNRESMSKPANWPRRRASSRMTSLVRSTPKKRRFGLTCRRIHEWIKESGVTPEWLRLVAPGATDVVGHRWPPGSRVNDVR